MNPPGKIRKAPDFMQLLKKRPTQLGIIYRNTTWRYKVCGHCREHFWKNSRLLNANPIKRDYCSKPCQSEGQRLRNAARQRRYKKRLAAGLVNHRSVLAKRGRRGGLNGKGISRRARIGA